MMFVHAFMVYSKNKLKELRWKEFEKLKKMRDFFRYHQVKFRLSNLDEYDEEHRFSSIGLIIEDMFVSYEKLLKEHTEIGKIVEKIKEAYEVARLGLEGKL